MIILRCSPGIYYRATINQISAVIIQLHFSHSVLKLAYYYKNCNFNIVGRKKKKKKGKHVGSVRLCIFGVSNITKNIIKNNNINN